MDNKLPLSIDPLHALFRLKDLVDLANTMETYLKMFATTYPPISIAQQKVKAAHELLVEAVQDMEKAFNDLGDED